MALLGAWLSVNPLRPDQKQFKIVSLTAFGVGSVIMVVLLWIHANDNAKEKQDASNAQQESRAILVQTQKEFRDFRGEVVEAAKRGQQVGTSDERLNSVLAALNKTLGRPQQTANLSPPVSLSPIASGTASHPTRTALQNRER